MEKKQLTYRQKIEAVLREVGLNKKDKAIEDMDLLGLGTFRTQSFQGRIGSDVTFTGEWSQNVAGGQYDRWPEELSVKLAYQGQKLCELMTPGRFVNIPEIIVVTPSQAGEAQGPATELGDQDHRLTVFHSPKDQAGALVDNIFRTVGRSIIKMRQAQKLNQLNLAGGKIKDNGNAANPNTNRDREM